MDVRSPLMVENAVGDEEDIKEMSEQLGCRPLYVCSSGPFLRSETTAVLEQCGIGGPSQFPDKPP